MGSHNDLHSKSLKDKFEEFHAQYPQVYRQLVRLSYEWRNAGGSKLGISTLFERLRWEWHTGTIKDPEGYKLNNNLKAYYARLIMSDHPDLDGLFDLRAQKVNS